MTVMEITLLALGVIIFALSFIVSDMKDTKSEKDIEKEREEIRKLMEQELSNMTLRVNEATNETVEYAMEKSERSLEKISNEKIMAVNEYSQTIVEELSKRHQEVMFLYDMLNDKQVDLKNVVRKAEATAKEVENASSEAVMVTEELNKAMSEPQYQTPYPNVQYPNFQYNQPQYSQPQYNDPNYYQPQAQGESVFTELQFVNTISDETEDSSDPFNVQYTEDQLEDIRQYGAPDLTAPRKEPVKKPEEIKKPDDVEILRARYKAMSDALDAMHEKEIREPAKKSKIQPVFSIFDEVKDDEYEKNVENMVINNSKKTEPEIKPEVKKAKKPSKGMFGFGDNHNQKILELYKEGKDTITIAKELNLGVGEVKLVIDLFEG